MRRRLAPGGVFSLWMGTDFIDEALLRSLVATLAAEFAYRHGGGDALFTSSPLQRALRDIRAADQHMLVTTNNYEMLGKGIVDETG